MPVNKVILFFLVVISQIFFQSYAIFENVSEKDIVSYQGDSYKISSGKYTADLTIFESNDEVGKIFIVSKDLRKKSESSWMHVMRDGDTEILDKEKFPEINKVEKLLFSYWLKYVNNRKLDARSINIYLCDLSLKSSKKPPVVHKKSFKKFCDVVIKTQS